MSGNACLFCQQGNSWYDLFITNQQLAVVNKVKLLAVIIRDDLKWDGQVENMCTKANQKFFMLRCKLKEAGFSSQELVTIYKGYMRPVLEYAVGIQALLNSETGGPGGEHPETCQQAYPRLGVYIIPRLQVAELELESLEHVEDRRLHISREFAVKCSTSGKFSAQWFPPSEYTVPAWLSKKAWVPEAQTKQIQGANSIHGQFAKGALDKYSICLFISNSVEDFKLNKNRNFQLMLPMRFHLMRYFVNSIIFRVSHRLLYCVFIEVNFEK